MVEKRSQAELDAWLKLAGMPWLGATVKAGLLKKFGNPLKIFMAAKAELATVKGWDHQRLERFVRQAPKEEPVCSLELLEKKGVRMICFGDDDYPPLLREIPDSPVVLFALGDADLKNRPALAIVGARKGTQLGYDIARDFAYELAAAGFVIVSGLALGIDTYAHRGALEAEGRTFAILGGGPDVIYPRGNQRIREKLLNNSGALLSEYPPGVIARPWHFPVRNRIISGICVGTLVIEASARSGSLITARLAAEQNREVFAVPGNIRSSLAEGTLNLIQEGANLVTDPAEIIEYFSHLLPKNKKLEIQAEIDDLTGEEKRLLQHLSAEPKSVEHLLETGTWKRERLFSLLLTLEMRDYLIKLPGNCYQAKIKLSREGSL
ncbi:MAG: processing protein [Clostridiales bacterium]|jgi:DNA processing protein|nr:processing protein [Clostridiales bacterium]MDN5281964.1 processing protein [Candidatus Ozemobacter sp.]